MRPIGKQSDWNAGNLSMAMVRIPMTQAGVLATSFKFKGSVLDVGGYRVSDYG
jgi:hypothetical protein